MCVCEREREREREYKCETCVYRKKFVEWWNQLFGKKIHQSKLVVEGRANEGEIVYKQEFIGELQKPREVKHTLKQGVITGYSCTPLNNETDSPDFHLVEGGINDNHIIISLTPVNNRKWGCIIHICGTKP
jgi:hypothetical protein